MRSPAISAVLLAIVLSSASAAAAPTQDVYVKGPIGSRSQHPARFPFSVNGDLLASHLRWTHWGRSSARARGSFAFSPRPAGSSPSVTLTGKLTLRRIVSCGGTRYYSQATITLDHPSRAPWRPLVNIQPC